jgi:hypothetical protein
MKNNFEQIKNIRMTSEEKHTLKERLFLNIGDVSIRTPYSFVSVFNMRARYTMVSGFAMILLAIFVQGADASLPGDTLYGMKRDVNERVLAAFAFSPSTKAKVETTLATRRLEEIEHVMLDMNKDGIGEEEKNEVLTELATAATEHSIQASAFIEDIHEDGDTDKALILASKLETTISIHAGILKEIDDATSNTENVSPISDALAIIVTTESTVEDLGGTIKNDISSDPSLIDEDEARQHLEEAVKNVLAYEEEFGPIDLEGQSVETDILSEETQMVISLDAASDIETEAGAALIKEESVEPSESNISDTELTMSIQSEPVLMSEDTEVAIDPEIPVDLSVKNIVQECKQLFDNQEYAASFVKCTEAIEAISALRIRMDLVEKTQTDPVEGVVIEDAASEESADLIAEESALEESTTANVSDVPFIESIQNSKSIKNLINQ